MCLSRSTYLLERVRVRGITAEHDSIAARLHNIPVVSAKHITAHAGAPMRHFESSDVYISGLHCLIPAQFLYMCITPRTQQVGSAVSGDHACSPVFELP